MAQVKFLVSGFESSGKSTIVSKIKDAFVINCDNKGYVFKVPHTNVREWRGFANFKSQVIDAIMRYKEKFGKLPKVLVIDTITQLYTSMTRYNSVAYKGYEIHKQNTTDTLEINNFLETAILPKMDLVIVAHTKIDEASGRPVIPASGQFKDSGSWHSIVNNSIFIDKSTGELIVYLKGFQYTTRTTLTDLPEYEMADKYDINAHLDKLRGAMDETTNLEV